MSRQNKVNPGTYTQRGRLTQDDAARELRKQKALGSPHTWQPVKKNAMPRPARAGDAGRGTETAADDAGQEETSPTVEAHPASPVTKKKTAVKAALVKLSKTVKSNTPKKAAGKAKAPKAGKLAAKRAVRPPA
ncbi:MAG TPA: hypothetical protein VFS23_42180 [Vicinamibacterales bacterium]|nr:hypothetical protein [Vicinamibacterales bacterium]